MSKESSPTPYEHRPDAEFSATGFESLLPLTHELSERHRVELFRYVEEDSAPVTSVDMHCWPETSSQPFRLRGQVQTSEVDTREDPLWVPHFHSALHRNLSAMSERYQNLEFKYADEERDDSAIYIRLSNARWAQIDVTKNAKSAASKVYLTTVSGAGYEFADETFDVNAADTSEDRLHDMLMFVDLVATSQRAVYDMAGVEEGADWMYELNAVPETLHFPSRELLNERRGGFDDIAGYDDVKSSLRDMALIVKYPELAEQVGVEGSQAVLLHGAAGVGKTALAEALATELGARVSHIDTSNIADKWVGSSARNVNELFDSITKNAKPGKLQVVVIDELEALAGNFREGETERSSALRALRKRMADMSRDNPSILVVGTTRDLDRVAPSVLGAGGFVPLEVPLPNEATRQAILGHLLADVDAHAMRRHDERPELPVLRLAEDVDVHALAAQSASLAGGDFAQIVATIKREHLRDYLRLVDAGKSAELTPISQADLARHINLTLRSREV